MKKHVSLLISLMLCVCLLFASVMPAYADDARVYKLTRVRFIDMYTIDLENGSIEIEQGFLDLLGLTLPETEAERRELMDYIQAEVVGSSSDFEAFKDIEMTLTLNGDGTGTLSSEEGGSNFTWTQNGDTVSIDELGNLHLSGSLATMNMENIMVFTFVLISGKAEKESGFVSKDGGLFFMIDGQVDTGKNGIVLDDKTGVFYFCALGRVQEQHVGLAEYDGEWFYLENGRLDTTRSGLVDYDGGRFMIAAGRILGEVNGLIMDPNGSGWYYLAGGQVQTQYTGLAFYDGEWFYVVNGRLDDSFTGNVDYDGATFHVDNGMVSYQL